MRSLIVLAVLFAVSCVPAPGLSVYAREPVGEPIDYVRDIAPIFQRRCATCHGEAKQESGLRLDRRALLLRGGDLGEPTVTPGNPAGSFLLNVVADQADIRMPPDGEPLAKAEVDVLRRWIQEGAKMPAELSGALKTQTHWSLQPLKRPATPPGSSQVDSPIDAFVARRLTPHDLRLSQEADRRTLIRRLYLVILGLPPTPEEVATFERDRREDAWERLVDRVLASPHYGERWAQHWLDVIRFGETHGFETNRERPHAWRYRDWVIQSLNADTPYDQFIERQIAGDLLGAPLGTGFLVAGPYDLVKSPDINLTLMQRQDELADVINATSSAFLGLTVGCARCHNHKFDPITQADYYSIQAVFAGLKHSDKMLPQTAEQKAELEKIDTEVAMLRRRLKPFAPNVDGLRPPVNAKHNVEQFAAVEAKWLRFTVEAVNSAQPCIDELEVFAADGGRNVALHSNGAKATSSSNLPGYEIHKLEHVNDGRYGNGRSWISNETGKGWIKLEFPQPVRIDRIEWARDREGRYGDRLATKYRIEIASEKGDDWKLIASSKDRRPFSTKTNEIVYDFARFPKAQADLGRALHGRLQQRLGDRARLSQAQQAYVGVFNQPGPTHRLYRGDPLAKREEVAPNAIAALADLKLAKNAPETERRLQFARWISDPANPLTARVLANRLWQHHFGVGIAATPSDLGASGAEPTHPELLDWLATELITNDWSLKHLHRTILCSKTWRQSDRPRDAALKVDASSRLLWRYPPRRLEAEAIRDAILSVTNSLDSRMLGRGFSGFEVQPENVRHYFPKKKYGPEDWRRMVYMTKVRQERESVFGVFDCPDASQLAPVRSRSTTPLQALNLLNSSFIMQQAELFAKRLEADRESVDAQIRWAYQLCYARDPQPTALQDARQFIAAEGLPAFCRAILNSNEFLYIP